MTEVRLIDGDKLEEERHPLMAWLKHGWRKRLCKRCGVLFWSNKRYCPGCAKEGSTP